MQTTETNKISKIFIITGVILLLFMLAAVWSIPRPSSDLLIALAGGRDVLAGKLNAPDTWSFSTSGRVWIDQNWGASVILYLVQKIAGETGLLAAKFLLLALCMLFLILALRELKIPLQVSLIVAAAITGCLNIYTILRPNLFTITFISLELWLLYKTTQRPYLVWVVVLVITLWANIHGGFIFGLGMLCLRTACVLIPEAVKEKWQVLKKRWQFPAAAASALLLAGLANPFGLTNLTFPFLMLKGSVWNTMRDWLPAWDTRQLSAFMSGISAFFAAGLITLLIAAVRLCFVILSHFRKRAQEPAEKGNPGIVLFDTALALVAVIMAMRSNRFIAIALVAGAPVLARQVWWLIRSTRLHRILPAVMQCIVLIYGSVIVIDNIRNYHPANPISNTGTGSLFERMHWVNINYDVEMARFINTNKISGNVFSPWQWEGFLRWNCPQLKIFTGGRAQQVYSEKTFNTYMYLTGSQVNSLQGKNPVDVLRTTNAHLLITGNSEDFYDLIMTALQSGNWVIIYADKRGLLFADVNWPGTAQIAARFASGELVFENPAAEAMSKAAFVFSQPGKWETENIMELFTKAFTLNPAWLWSYKMLFSNFHRNAGLFGQYTEWLDRQQAFLETLPLDNAEAADILRCRIALSDMLAALAKQLNQAEKAAQESRSNAAARELLAGLKTKWKQWLIN